MRWEYLTLLQPLGDELGMALAQAGVAGWEMVACFPCGAQPGGVVVANGPGVVPGVFAVFKRPIPADAQVKVASKEEVAAARRR